LQAQTVNSSLATAGNYKYANAYQVNDFASVVNGGSAIVDTSGTLPVVNSLFLGVNAVGNSAFLNGTIRKIAFWPKRVSNAELQGLTS
jgi:hypothetical protein